MTISYNCEVPLRGVRSKTRKALMSTLDANDYEWYIDKSTSTLIIIGELEADDYATNADDVTSEIEWIVDSTTGITVTARAKEVEYEPDWDKMPGGYDYGSWN